MTTKPTTYEVVSLGEWWGREMNTLTMTEAVIQDSWLGR